MFRSAAFALAALAGFFAVSASAETPVAPRCDDMSFRVYFDHGSAELTPAAMEVIDVAMRNMAGCRYAEVSIAADSLNTHAQQRGQAILSALNGRAWDAMQLEPMAMTHAASRAAAPEFVEVAMRAQPSESPASLSAGGHVGV